MTKTISNREICSIKAVILLCEHGQKIGNGVFTPPSPHTIRVNYVTNHNVVFLCKEFSCAPTDGQTKRLVDTAARTTRGFHKKDC